MITRNEFNSMLSKSGLIDEVFCGDSESKEYETMYQNSQPLPENVHRISNDINKKVFYTRITKADLTEEEQKQYLFLKLMSDVQSMKNCMIFFTVITIISLIATLFVSCSVMR